MQFNKDYSFPNVRRQLNFDNSNISETNMNNSFSQPISNVIPLNRRLLKLRNLILIKCEDITENGYKAIGNFKNLISLVIDSYAEDYLNDTVLFNLSKLSKLKKLYLHNSNIMDEGIVNLSTFHPNLTELSIKDSLLTNNCFESISKLKKMRILTLNIQTDEPLSIIKISNLTNIVILNIGNTFCNDDTVKIITKSFINLKKLNIRRTQITNLSLEYLKMINLEILNVGFNDIIDDTSLKLISEMQYIKELYLDRCLKITRTGLFMLSSLKNLNYLIMDQSILQENLKFYEYINKNDIFIKNNNIKQLMKYCKYLIRINDMIDYNKEPRVRIYYT